MDLPLADTNGAGDGLAVGFLSSLVLEGRSLEASVTRGQILARHTCGQRGRSDGLMGAGQLEDAWRRLAPHPPLPRG